MHITKNKREVMMFFTVKDLQFIAHLRLLLLKENNQDSRDHTSIASRKSPRLNASSKRASVGDKS